MSKQRIPRFSSIPPFLEIFFILTLIAKLEEVNPPFTKGRFKLWEDYNIENYADDNTPYLSGKNVDQVLNCLQNLSSNLFQWFAEIELNENASKCHLLISSGENVHVNIGTSQIKNSDCERLLGIDIDCKLSFENHINQMCSKARAKFKALARIAPFLNKKERKLLMNAFFKSQFSYCSLSWMFHSRTLNNKINRLHKRCLHIIYNEWHYIFFHWSFGNR